MGTIEARADVSQEAVDQWIRSYQGEVLGEAYFGHMAANTADPTHRSKLEVLTTLERCTKELLAAALEQARHPDGARPRGPESGGQRHRLRLRQQGSDPPAHHGRVPGHLHASPAVGRTR